MLEMLLELSYYAHNYAHDMQRYSVTSQEDTPSQLPVILVKKLLHSSFSQSVTFALSVVLTLCFISVDLPDVYHW